MSKKLRVKGFKINVMTSNLIDVFEIIYTESAKSQVFKYNIQNNPLFQYQTKRTYYKKIFEDLMDNGVKSLEHLNSIVTDFEEKESKDKSVILKSIELPEDLFDKVNAYIKEKNLIGQTFILQALERTIIRNDLDVNYLKMLVDKIEKVNNNV
ncbi:hypothetical protein O0I16_10830 [Staphylococcus pseudintermedius]|uniref:hypothetical protein n=1 Tax=Staphylococcus pseudintermedius TaxID=283734 RepID=UPI00143F303A|nr:hypothetical protein [Staphylococcus pseudintermedius]EGQ3717847.1 hypothetical protein [Staphylococcus pseudintermedius]MDE9985313.1 hypothetical protein [Staphylococcus pseudintermedius]MDE9987680.1 hypothetical protein [Staphylococcus pseudintermedius]MDE9999678.1 hypothetical protein [Staphylococcus pseudintermedius]MDF0029738.1 hypothetical protein [Staphylococcus pseudintermedius]